MALANTFTAFAQVKQATVLVNGISCDLEQGILKVEFVTPDVVRVQYTGGKYVYRKRNGCLFATCS